MRIKNNIKRIPYGKSDFEAINQHDYYVDKTHYIPDLELVPFPIFNSSTSFW